MSNNLWPFGIGLTDRLDVGWGCACCPTRPDGGCCTLRPTIWTDANRSYTSQAPLTSTGCCCGQPTVEGDFLGAHLKFVHVAAGCCSDAEVDVSENGYPIGKILKKTYCCPCSCGERDVADVIDQNTTRSRYTIRQPGCCHKWPTAGGLCGGGGCCTAPTEDGTCCGVISHDLPISQAHGVAGDTGAYISFRHNWCCPSCYPIWFGIKKWPAGSSDADRKLLLGAVQSMTVAPQNGHYLMRHFPPALNYSVGMN